MFCRVQTHTLIGNVSELVLSDICQADELQPDFIIFLLDLLAVGHELLFRHVHPEMLRQDVGLINRHNPGASL